jgi:transcriptional antiterminator NusG
MVEELQKDWYVVHTYSGYEHKVKANLEQRRESMGMSDYMFDVIVPESEVIKTDKDGKSKTVIENDYPGYVLIEMIMTDKSWFVVRNTPGVTGFLGSHGKGSKPNPVTKDEIDHIMRRMQLVEVRTEDFQAQPGEVVQIISGAMSGMDGKVVSINKDERELIVSVDMFGRETEATVSFNDVVTL